MSKTTGLLVVIGLFAIVSVGSASAESGPALRTYVVVLTPDSDNVATVAARLARDDQGTVGFVYHHALRGFSIRSSPTGAALIARNPQVAYVEPDQIFTVAAQSMPTGIDRVLASGNPNIGIDGVDDKRVDVDVAVIDSGIDLDHPDLNVVGSTNCATFFATCGSGGDDGNGHGTHVAGTIGALDNGIGVVGVAPGVRLWSVRVLGNNGTGTTSQIVAGMDWVTAHASTIDVANVSITGGASASVDAAVSRMADAGVAVAVAAGNNDADASAYSPARASKVLTVSALADYDGLAGGLGSPPSSFCLDQDDTLVDSSNWGSTIEVAAPGCRILSTYLSGGYAWINGTSMASAHVAGALALLASKGFTRNYTGVAALYAAVVSSGNLNWTDESGDGVQEPLLDVSGPAFAPVLIDSSGPPPNQPPTAAITSSCGGLTCSLSGSESSDADGSITSYSWNFGDGSQASGPSSTSHTYAAGGTYSVTLTVTDDDGAQGSTSKNVTVAAPPTVSLTGSGTSNGSTWTATVTIVVTSNGSPIATGVSGMWTAGASGSGSCSTTPAPCTVTKLGIRRSTSSVRFSVASVGGSSSFTGTKAIVVPRP